ncbi:MAG TPA: hypothetical protein PLW83_06540, partial [Deltaproteobacteria bacterium]|nr:hypothetical protein [Deltaproteobacteria bacterium]
MGSIKRTNAHAEGWFFLNNVGESAYKKHRKEIEKMNNETVSPTSTNDAATSEPKPAETKANGKH